MIRVTVTREADGKVSGYQVEGHSGTAAHGEDIVCAGVSALAQTALLGIGEYLHREVSYKVASGKLMMYLKDAPDTETEAVLQTMLLGIRAIERTHPEAVCVKEKSGGEIHVPV